MSTIISSSFKSTNELFPGSVIDQNRFRNTYNFLRKDRGKILEDSTLLYELSIETGVVEFDADIAIVSLANNYGARNPNVTLTLETSNDEDQDNVNLWAEPISGTSLTIRASAIFSGRVHFHIIEFS